MYLCTRGLCTQCQWLRYSLYSVSLLDLLLDLVLSQYANSILYSLYGMGFLARIIDVSYSSVSYLPCSISGIRYVRQTRPPFFAMVFPHIPLTKSKWSFSICCGQKRLLFFKILSHKGYGFSKNLSHKGYGFSQFLSHKGSISDRLAAHTGEVQKTDRGSDLPGSRTYIINVK